MAIMHVGEPIKKYQGIRLIIKPKTYDVELNEDGVTIVCNVTGREAYLSHIDAIEFLCACQSMQADKACALWLDKCGD